MNELKISICQIEVVGGNPDRNRKHVLKWVQKTVENDGPDIIVLPEMWTTGYALPELKKIADIDGEPTTTFLRNLAKKYNVNIVGGSFANKVKDNVYNTAIVIDRKGEVVYEYEKVHLVPMLDEHLYLTGGTNSHSFELEGYKMGLIICYDLRFPELTRSLALEGAEVLFIVAEWPASRKKHWEHLQLARAIENQFYVVSSNVVGTFNNVKYGGTSMIITPNGDVLVKGSEEKEEMITYEIDITKVREIREQIPVFQNRVPDVYNSGWY